MPEVTSPTVSPPASTGLPWRGMPAPSISNGASFSAVPSRRARAIGLGADEPRLLHAAPAEPGLDRVALGGEVVAVQVEADLEPQRVAGAEPAGDDARVEQLGPDRRRHLGVEQQLDPVLAGVAGAANQGRPGADPRRGDPHPRRQLDAERAADDGAGMRPLHREHRVAVGDVAHGRPRSRGSSARARQGRPRGWPSW